MSDSTPYSDLTGLAGPTAVVPGGAAVLVCPGAAPAAPDILESISGAVEVLLARQPVMVDHALRRVVRRQMGIL